MTALYNEKKKLLMNAFWLCLCLALILLSLSQLIVVIRDYYQHPTSNLLLSLVYLGIPVVFAKMSMRLLQDLMTARKTIGELRDSTQIDEKTLESMGNFRFASLFFLGWLCLLEIPYWIMCGGLIPFLIQLYSESNYLSLVQALLFPGSWMLGGCVAMILLARIAIRTSHEKSLLLNNSPSG